MMSACSSESGARRVAMKRPTALAVIVVATLSLSLLACGSPESEEATGGRLEGVMTETVEMSTVPTIYEASGVVRSKTRASLSTKLMGDVRSILVREGDRVETGQVLMTIDARDVEAGLRQAEASLAEIGSAIQAAEAATGAAEANQKLASATFGRFKVLKERQSVSDQEYEEIEARHAVANAELERARQSLAQLRARKNQVEAGVSQARAAVSWSQITSPVDGVVVAKFVDVGDQASPGRTLIEVEQEGLQQVEANVEESLIGKIRVGDPAEIRVDAIDLRATGVVSEVVPSLDSAMRSFVVKIDLPEDASPENLRSGLFARVSLALGERQAILVPAEAVVTRGQLTGVWTVGEGGVARFRLVKAGRAFGDRLEILSGLDSGERIVPSDVERLTDGAQVVRGDGETNRP